MQKSLFTLLLLSALALPQLANSDTLSDHQDAQVISKEFQFDKNFVPPKRALLLDNKKYSELKSTLESSPQANNKRLALIHPEPKYRDTRSTVASNDFWIYDSWLSLSNDLDYDGYYSTLTVEFDVDTVYSRAYVYAIIYLGVNGLFEPIHTTSVFAIDSDISEDSFIVESELISGFPSNDYEIMIELYDADTNQFVAFSDGYEDADLAFAPLESVNFETLPEPPVIIIEEHGGSLGIWAMFGIGLAAFRRLSLS
jgi:hypothetical protein